MSDWDFYQQVYKSNCYECGNGIEDVGENCDDGSDDDKGCNPGC